MKLTKNAVDKLPTPENAATFYRDDEILGFGVKVFPSGTKTFFLEKRIEGKVRRMKIGRYGVLTADQARKEAVKLAGDIAKGGNPVKAKAKIRLEAKTLQHAFDDYFQRRTLKPQTVFDIQRCMNECFPDWLDKPMKAITADMISKRHRDHGAERSEARSNLAMRYLRAVFNFAIESYLDTDGLPLITDNPVKRAMNKAWFRVERRQTIIKPHELGAWVQAVMELPHAETRDFFMTVLLTGLRHQEALGLQWKNVDLAGKTLTVIDPKNHHDHTLPLSDYLLELLARRKAVSVSDDVFATPAGNRIKNIRFAQASVTKSCDVAFCVHDLRRTFATIAESLDVPGYALKRLLNHANGSDVTAGYIVNSPERLREPMQKVTDYVLKSAGLKESAQIPPFKHRYLHNFTGNWHATA
jgi:integrase